jgi:phosphoribosylformylglycinamidine synthase I
MKAAVIRFPGSNCDQDACYAVSQAGVEPVLVWHAEHDLPSSDVVILPGGFTYGDYLRSGAMAALSPIMAAVSAFASRGGPVIGICNGFQILTEAGLLPGQLTRNISLRFICKDVTVRVENARTPFTVRYEAGQNLRIPVAHNEGRFIADKETLDRLEQQDCVVFRYGTGTGKGNSEENPNGSLRSIAGIVNEGGNVLGMMPHPERATETILGSTDGAPLFQSLFESVRA